MSEVEGSLMESDVAVLTALYRQRRLNELVLRGGHLVNLLLFVGTEHEHLFQIAPKTKDTTGVQIQLTQWTGGSTRTDPFDSHAALLLMRQVAELETRGRHQLTPGQVTALEGKLGGTVLSFFVSRDKLQWDQLTVDQARDLWTPSAEQLRMDQPGTALLGATVSKEFPGHGTFTGTVREYDSTLGYRVVYSDGDIEDCSPSEVARMLVPSAPGDCASGGEGRVRPQADAQAALPQAALPQQAGQDTDCHSNAEMDTVSPVLPEAGARAGAETDGAGTEADAEADLQAGAKAGVDVEEATGSTGGEGIGAQSSAQTEAEAAVDPETKAGKGPGNEPGKMTSADASTEAHADTKADSAAGGEVDTQNRKESGCEADKDTAQTTGTVTVIDAHTDSEAGSAAGKQVDAEASAGAEAEAEGGTEREEEPDKDAVKDISTGDAAETVTKDKVGVDTENRDTKCESGRVQRQPQLQHGNVAEQVAADITDVDIVNMVPAAMEQCAPQDCVAQTASESLQCDTSSARARKLDDLSQGKDSAWYREMRVLHNNDETVLLASAALARDKNEQAIDGVKKHDAHKIAKMLNCGYRRACAISAASRVPAADVDAFMRKRAGTGSSAQAESELESGLVVGAGGSIPAIDRLRSPRGSKRKDRAAAGESDDGGNRKRKRLKTPSSLSPDLRLGEATLLFHGKAAKGKMQPVRSAGSRTLFSHLATTGMAEVSLTKRLKPSKFERQIESTGKKGLLLRLDSDTACVEAVQSKTCSTKGLRVLLDTRESMGKDVYIYVLPCCDETEFLWDKAMVACGGSRRTSERMPPTDALWAFAHFESDYLNGQQADT